MNKSNVLNWISHTAKRAKLVASVCTGVFLLAEAGVLSGHAVTTHWEDIPNLQQNFPNLHVLENQRWVDEGSIITSAKISEGIDMSLYLVSKLQSLELAEKTALQMEYDWQKNS